MAQTAQAFAAQIVSQEKTGVPLRKQTGCSAHAPTLRQGGNTLLASGHRLEGLEEPESEHIDIALGSHDLLRNPQDIAGDELGGYEEWPVAPSEALV